jgi:hypothetical protein
MNTTQISIKAPLRDIILEAIWKYVLLFPHEDGPTIGDRLRYKLGATTARTALVPAEFPNDSDELGFPLDIVYEPETAAVRDIVESIHKMLSALPGDRLQYLHSYFKLIGIITYEIQGAS